MTSQGCTQTGRSVYRFQRVIWGGEDAISRVNDQGDGVPGDPGGGVRGRESEGGCEEGARSGEAGGRDYWQLTIMVWLAAPQLPVLTPPKFGSRWQGRTAHDDAQLQNVPSALSST